MGRLRRERRSSSRERLGASLGVAIFLTGCAPSAPAPTLPNPPATSGRCSEPPHAHYLDADGNELERYDEIWDRLHAAFGSDAPATIHVALRARGTSMFHVESGTVEISVELIDGVHRTMKSLIAHESAHLFLAALTKSASTHEELRFVDEGLASLIEHGVAGDLDAYKLLADHRTAARLSQAPFGLAELERWSTFFGSDGHMDFGAYDVGASFVAFVARTHGDEKLRALFHAIGETSSLERAAPLALGRPLSEIESAWLAAMRAIPVERPSIESLSPVGGTHDVSTTTQLLVAKFDRPMEPIVCLETPCKEGICFDHAHWRDERTLEIAIDRPLLVHHAYRLRLGTPTCRLRATTGEELAVTDWSFETR